MSSDPQHCCKGYDALRTNSEYLKTGSDTSGHTSGWMTRHLGQKRRLTINSRQPGTNQGCGFVPNQGHFFFLFQPLVQEKEKEK
jgi:hypothetical protein